MFRSEIEISIHVFRYRVFFLYPLLLLFVLIVQSVRLIKLIQPSNKRNKATANNPYKAWFMRLTAEHYQMNHNQH